MSPPREDRLLPGVALVAAAFFCFAWVDTAAKILSGLAVPVLITVFFRYAGNAVLVLAWFLPREGRMALVSVAPGLQLVRGLFLLFSTVLNFSALTYLPLTTTIPIFFAMPLMVCLLSVPLLGESVGIRRLTAVAVGFVGVLVIVRPGGVDFHWAMLLSIAATLCNAFYVILTRRLAGRDGTAVSQIYASGVATLAILPVALAHWQWPDGALQWGLLLMAGAGAALGHSLLTIAFRYGEAAALSPAMYSQIVVITAISWAIFGQVPDGWTAAGTAVIVGSGLYVWWRERKLG